MVVKHSSLGKSIWKTCGQERSQGEGHVSRLRVLELAAAVLWLRGKCNIGRSDLKGYEYHLRIFFQGQVGAKEWKLWDVF